MPTGYTSKLYDGKQQSFEEFVWGCARAFGALVTMRDDPSDAPIPERLEPSPFYTDSLKAVRANLDQARQWTPLDAERAMQAAYDKEVASWNDRRIERDARRQRYEAMLKQVDSWHPPSAEHIGLQDFMRQQISSSIEFDCGGDWDRAPTVMSGLVFQAKRISELERDLAYHEKSLAEELERVKNRNEWIRLLRGSLGK